jgi:hypothetical protein
MCGSDEPHLHPVRSFTYRNEQVRADEVQMEIVCTLNHFELILHFISLVIVI